jgi:prepilin-type N-terminal cleavage/methylation domain-containing protein
MKSSIKRHASMRSMTGFSLIEVMVSVVIIAIGLLGIAAMQAMALRGSQSSLETSQAVIQSNSILEAIRANSANAPAYNMAMTCNLPPGGTLVNLFLRRPGGARRPWPATLRPWCAAPAGPRRARGLGSMTP